MNEHATCPANLILSAVGLEPWGTWNAVQNILQKGGKKSDRLEGLRLEQRAI